MALTFPRTDVLSVARYSDQKFKLVSRQELSSQGNGVVRGKDFGSAIWTAEYSTTAMRSDDGVAFEALLNSLDGVIQPFEAYDLRRKNPRMYPDGAFADSGYISFINTNNKAIALSGLPANFVLSPGDYLSFDYGDNDTRALHQVVEGITANASGQTNQFEIRPFLRPGVEVDTDVTLKNPRGLFTLLPDSVVSSVSSGLITQISFKAIQYL
jgi:hypothetical protein